MKTALRKTTHPTTETQHNVISLPPRVRTLRYTGPVMRATNERILKEMTRLMDTASQEEIALFVTSPGGPTGTAMSFYDSVRHLIQPTLVTIGSGDVDSSGVIIFLSGTRRYITNHATMLFHPAGRIFGNQRYTTKEMEAMLSEDRIKDQQYASVIAENSKGKLMIEEVLVMMEHHTIRTPQKMLELGLADAILP